MIHHYNDEVGRLQHEFSRPEPIEYGIAIGHQILPGRADIALLAIKPESAPLERVVVYARKIIETMPPGEDTRQYRDAVEETFFKPAT